MFKWLPLAVAVLSVSWLLFRGWQLRRKSLMSNPLKETSLEISQRLNSPVGRIHQMETRLYDYGREVEGRIGTTLAVLDKLVMDAQKESDRLESLLEEMRQQSEKNAA